MVRRPLQTLAACALAALCLTQIACGPEYPKCDTSEDCRSSDKGKKENKLICVQGKCQQCLKDVDCGDPSKQCNAGICERIPDYCASVSDCGAGQKCEGNRCKPECAADSECGTGKKCDAGRCVTAAECTTDTDCGDGKQCNAEGKCEPKPVVTKPPCELNTVYFEYDQSDLRDEARQTLQANATCIKDEKRNVRLEGHADERGSTEYNLALGERRARAVYDYLKALGVSADSLKRLSYGEERPERQCAENDPDSCHRTNRRVVFGSF